MRRAVGAIVGMTVALGLCVFLVNPAPAAADSKLIPPNVGIWLGAFVDPDGRWSGVLNQKQEVQGFERRIGRELDIDHHYYAWSGSSQSFPGAMDRWDVHHGRIPFISWAGTALHAVISGSQDSLIRERARSVKNFGHRVFISWASEMNGNWSVWDGTHNNSPGTTNGPAKFVQAWRHIHDIFTAEGATNVTWVWAPNDQDIPNKPWNHWSRYYPGDGYVDWVGIDGYNWGTSEPWSHWTPFVKLLSRVYHDYATRKPIMVVETSSVEKGGSKAEWIRQMWESLVYRLPLIKAVMWTERGPEWKVETSKASLHAFRSMAESPYFTQRRDTGAPRVSQLRVDSIAGARLVTLEFKLSEPAQARILIRNGAGNVIRALTLGAQAPGARDGSWDRCNLSGARVPPGSYRWTVRAVDASGNARKAASSVRVS